MIVHKTSVFSFTCLLFLLEFGYGERAKDKMYETIEGSKACFRRMNATHQIGCSSKRGGSTGAIHYCENQADLDFILKNGTAGPYVPVLPISLLTPQNLNKCKKSNKISGMLLYVTEDKPKDFSHDKQCPNEEYGLKGTCGNGKPVWNPKGTGLLFEDIPFPIFYVESAEHVSDAKTCFQKHNNFSFDTQRDRSLCSLQLSSFMYAAKDTPTCIRRSNLVTNLNPVKFCDPLGDRNVWATLFPLVHGPNMSEPNENDKYIIVSARLDTTSMFDKTSGAASPISGLVALLATAKLLKTILPTQQPGYHKNVLFVLFNGETYDYIGSQRFLYDMQTGEFPRYKKLPSITMENISLFVELSQLTRLGGDKVHAHYLNNDQTEQFYQKLEENRVSGLQLEKSVGFVPPASLHTFLRNNSELPGLVLADHSSDGYVNPYYNSIFDNASNIQYKYFNLSAAEEISVSCIQNFVADVASMVAKALYQEVTGEPYQGDAAKADVQFIDELFHCYLETSFCKVHRVVSDDYEQSGASKEPSSLYVGVDAFYNYITTLVGLTLGWATSDDLGDPSNCSNVPRNYAYRLYNMSANLNDLNSTHCFRTSMNASSAESPAFIIDDYDWSSSQYSSWSESTWGEIKLRLYLKPSAAHENMTIAIGSIVFIFATLLIYFVKSRSDILFTPPIPTIAPTDC